MDIPLSVLQGLNFNKPKEPEIQQGLSKNWNPNQYNKQENYCPVGCDPSRTGLLISKNGKKNKGNFVHVFYRGSKLKEEIPIEVKREKFWREFDELEERNRQLQTNRERMRSPHDGVRASRP